MNGLGSALWSNLKAGARLALFLPVRFSDFRISAGHYATLLLASLAAWLIGGIARQGFPGAFDTGALTLNAAQIPVILAVCLLAATLLRNAAHMLAFAVTFTASDPLFELAAIAGYYAVGIETVAPYAPWINGLFVLWALTVLLRAQWVVSGWQGWRSLGAAAMFTLLLAFFAFSVPRTELWNAVGEAPPPPGQDLLREDVFHHQAGLMGAQLASLEPERAGVEDLYFVGAASYGLQDTFAKELAMANELMAQRFDTAKRSVVLVNHPSTLGNTPIATATNLRAALEHLGRIIDPEEDVVMLFLTTHGYDDGRLAFEMPPLTLAHVNPAMLARILADSGIKWKIIVISACYSGRFIEPLRDETSLIVTAADASHSSFGCEFGSDLTWFGQAFFNEGLRSTRSFSAAFAHAQKAIGEREAKEGYKPSNPQIYLGSEMKAKLESLGRRLESLAN